MHSWSKALQVCLAPWVPATRAVFPRTSSAWVKTCLACKEAAQSFGLGKWSPKQVLSFAFHSEGTALLGDFILGQEESTSMETWGTQHSLVPASLLSKHHSVVLRKH